MKILNEIGVAVGKLAYAISLPLLRISLRKSQRAYVLIRHNDEVLALKSWLGRDEWQLPGGGIKSYETPKLAAIREVWEEVGVELSPEELKIKTSGKWETDNLGHFYIIFEAYLNEKAPLQLHALEIRTAKWLKDAEIIKKTPSEIKSALQK